MTILFGSPWIANTDLNFSIITTNVADETGIMSMHLEWASTITKTFYLGAVRHSPNEVWTMALKGWVAVDDWTGTFHMISLWLPSLSSCAKLFIFMIQGCVSCSSSITVSHPQSGMMTLNPQRIHPSNPLYSSFLTCYAFVDYAIILFA